MDVKPGSKVTLILEGVIIIATVDRVTVREEPPPCDIEMEIQKIREVKNGRQG